MHNYRFLKAYNSWKECYTICLQKSGKNMATKELKQIWNSAVAVDITVATIAVAVAVAILKQFRAGYLQNCDLQFSNRTYACPRLLFTLIFQL